MPVQRDTDNIASSGAGVSTLGVALTVANNSDRCLYGILIGSSTVSRTITSATWGADSMVNVFSQEVSIGGFFVTISLWRLLGAAAEARTLTINMSGVFTELSVGALSLYTVNQSDPDGTQQVTNGTTGSPWAACDGTAGGLSIGMGYVVGAAITPTDGIPQYIAVGTAVQSAGATTLTPGAPAGALLGDLDFASIATENNAAIGVSGAGWARVGSNVAQDATWQEELWMRIHTGSNVDPVFSWTGSVGCSARRWIVRDAAASSPIGFHNTNSGTGATHTCTGANSTGNDSLAMCLSHAEANTALGADAGYAEQFDAGSNTGPYRLVVGARDQATSGAGADNFSATGANASWVMRIWEVLNAANGDQTQRREAQNVGAFASMSFDTEVSDTYNAFGWTELPTQWVAAAIGVNEAVAGNDIAAAGALSISGVADLDATGSLAAAGAVSITGAADLDASGALAAAGSLSISGAADLDASGALAAAGALSISGAADLDAVGSLIAAGSIAISGAADLTSGADNDISATGALSITGSADLDAVGTLIAAGSIVITGVADLTSAGGNDIEATGQLSITGSAGLTAFGALIASGDIVITGSADLSGAAPVVPEEFSGGFFIAFEREQERRRRRQKKRQEEVEAVEALQDRVEREIGVILKEQEAHDDERAEIERLRTLVTRFNGQEAQEALTERVRTAFARAAVQQNASALLAFDREMRRMLEEEELSVLLALLDD